MSTSSISCSSDVSEKALLERYLSPKSSQSPYQLTPLPGSRRSTQADTRLVRPQIHQQNKVCANEGRRQCHSGATLARGGVPPWLSFSPSPTTFRQIDHPFVVNLRYAFQDDENCFFVLDLMLGGDLRCPSFSISITHTGGLTFSTVHLDRLGSLPEETVKFYMAELSSALCFLHDKHIMHRCAVPSVISVFPLILVPLPLLQQRHQTR